jgi:hypothetical protein
MSKLRELASKIVNDPEYLRRACRIASSGRRKVKTRIRSVRNKLIPIERIIAPRGRFRIEVVKESQAPPLAMSGSAKSAVFCTEEAA